MSRLYPAAPIHPAGLFLVQIHLWPGMLKGSLDRCAIFRGTLVPGGALGFGNRWRIISGRPGQLAFNRGTGFHYGLSHILQTAGQLLELGLEFGHHFFSLTGRVNLETVNGLAAGAYRFGSVLDRFGLIECRPRLGFVDKLDGFALKITQVELKPIGELCAFHGFKG